MFNHDTSVALLTVAFVLVMTGALLCFASAVMSGVRKPVRFYLSGLASLVLSVLGLLVLTGLISLGVKTSLGLFIVAFMLVIHMAYFVTAVTLVTNNLNRNK